MLGPTKPPSPPGPAPPPAGGHVTGPGNVTIHSITGEFVYTSAKIVGNWSCSDASLNAIHSMILPAMKSNLQGIFTDCPHRERLGWLEQSWLLAKSVGHNFDISTLYAKIAQDMAEAQDPDGCVPDIAPEYVRFSGGFRDSPEWGLAFVMVPVYLYDEYNDTAALRKFYPGMKRYIDYLTSRADQETGIISYGLSDWTCTQCVDMGVTATMVYIEGLQNMERMATALGKAATDGATFKALAAKSVKGYTNKWYDAATGAFDTAKGSGAAQCATSMPLALGVAPSPALGC